MYKVVKNDASSVINKRDITLKQPISNKISILDTSEGGSLIVANIPDYVPDGLAFATIICKCLNENKKYFTLAQLKKMKVKPSYGSKSRLRTTPKS